MKIASYNTTQYWSSCPSGDSVLLLLFIEVCAAVQKLTEAGTNCTCIVTSILFVGERK